MHYAFHGFRPPSTKLEPEHLLNVMYYVLLTFSWIGLERFLLGFFSP